MRLLKRSIGVLVLLLLVGLVNHSPAMAMASFDEDDEECIVIVHTAHDGDDLHVDLYVSNVVYKDGKFYINGEAYPKGIVRHLERIVKITDNPNFVQNINPNNPTKDLNPIINPIRDELAGPLIQFLGDLDLEDPPVIRMEVRIPAPSDGVDGVRLSVIINSPICIENAGG